MSVKYRISELAQMAGVTKRTVHYYIGRGLLPPPDGAGVGSLYSEEHLVKLHLIKKLQRLYLPLDKIRAIVAEIDLEDAQRLLTDDHTGVEAIVFKTSAEPDHDRQERAYNQPEPGFMKDAAIDDILSTLNVKNPGYNQNYVRCDLGLGIELHYPADLLADNPTLLASIEKYIRKMIEEK